MENKEMELADYLEIIWKKKWLVLAGTFVFVLITVLFTTLMRPVYEIDSIIQPGKFFVRNQSGHFEEVVVEDPVQIADKVKHRSYNMQIAANLNVNLSNIPFINAEHFRDTLLTRVWIRDPRVELSKKVLQSLVNLIKSEIDEKVEIEFAGIDSNIKTEEIEKERRLNEIEIIKKKLQIIGQRKKDILDEMKTVRKRIEMLEEEQLKVLKNEDKGEAVSLGLLLYSTEVEQSFRTHDVLNEKLSQEKLKEEDANSALQAETSAIANIDNRIAILAELKGRIDYTKIVKAPQSSLSPVWPNRSFLAMVAFLLGLLVFIPLAFLINYIESKKIILKEK